MTPHFFITYWRSGRRTVIKLLLVLVSVTSCKDKEEQLPAYLYIPSYTVTTTSVQGSNSSRITDAWVFVGGQLIGTFPLPARVPVLAQGNQPVSVWAGILNNGITASRSIYPFYQRYALTRNLVPLSVDTLYPTTTYIPEAQFLFIEDYDGIGTIMSSDIDGNANTAFVPTTDGALSGNSGLASLNTSNPLLEVASNVAYTLPSSTLNNCYLELDYSSNNTLSVGIQANYAAGTQPERRYRLTLFPTEGVWKKIYVPMFDDVRGMNGNTYQILFRALLDSGRSDAQIRIDNVKFIYN